MIRSATIIPHNIKNRGGEIPGLVQRLKMPLRTRVLLTFLLFLRILVFVLKLYPSTIASSLPNFLAQYLNNCTYTFFLKKRLKRGNFSQKSFGHRKEPCLLPLSAPFSAQSQQTSPWFPVATAGPHVDALHTRESGKVCPWLLQSPYGMSDSVCQEEVCFPSG